MDDIPFVQVIEAFKDLANEILHQRLLESTIVAQECRYGTTRNVFQEDVEVVVIEG